MDIYIQLKQILKVVELFNKITKYNNNVANQFLQHELWYNGINKW